MPNKSLDRPCGTCRRRAGDHTLDEWWACVGTPSHSFDFEATTDEETQRLLRTRFSGLEGYAIADAVVSRAAVIDGEVTGGLDVHFAVLLLEFSTQDPVRGPIECAKVAFVAANPDVMRHMGRLMTDSANGAASAAEQRNR